MRLEDLFRDRSVDIPRLMDRLRKVADEEGLLLGHRTMTYNSRLAQELGKWAESQGRGAPYHQAVFQAYFADGINIGKVPELIRLAASLDLSAEKAGEVLAKRNFRNAVDADWNRSRELGITAVPTFVMGPRVLVGAHPYKVLRRFVRAGHAGEKGRPVD
jgi:predicted DsbA family dithiol-disulfide isomerase